METVGVIVATHDRTDDAKASMELMRGLWMESREFDRVVIVHTYNGPRLQYSGTGMEDVFVPVSAESTHFRGAASLIDAGFNEFAVRHPEINYVVVIAADVWLYKASWVREIVDRMKLFAYRVAGSSWQISFYAHGLARNEGSGLLPAAGLSSDFFVVDRMWAVSTGMLPLCYATFLDRYGDLLNYFHEMPFLERYLAGRFLGAVRRQMEGHRGKDPWGSGGLRRAKEMLLLLDERSIDPEEVRGPAHKGHWPRIGLVTSEDPRVKQSIVRAHPDWSGRTIDRLRSAADLAWYNSE